MCGGGGVRRFARVIRAASLHRPKDLLIFHDKVCKTGFIRLPLLHEQSGERSGRVCLLVTVLLQN